jgi:hypothetical protein
LLPPAKGSRCGNWVSELKRVDLAPRLLRDFGGNGADPPSPPSGAGYRYLLSILEAEFSLTQALDQPVTGRIFFEEVIRELDIGRPVITIPSSQWCRTCASIPAWAMGGRKSVPLDPAAVASYDAVLIVTDHDCVELREPRQECASHR